MSPERETLLDDIALSLWTLTEDNLRSLCERCGICGKDGSEVKGESQRSLRRKILEEYCENADVTESEEQGMSRLLQLKEDITGIEEEASLVPASPSQSATAGSSQACCHGEQNEERGDWFPSRQLEAEPVPHWLIIPQQRATVRGNGEDEPNSPLSFKSETKCRESLGPGCDGGQQAPEMASWQTLKRLTVLLEDCRFMPGQRVNIKAEEEEEEIISVFADDAADMFLQERAPSPQDPKKRHLTVLKVRRAPQNNHVLNGTCTLERRRPTVQVAKKVSLL
ncbi:uncharacterized protein [Salvelinus alpinus]|uniref:uncharacterized protein n=1 Tax=Salvelinus alpinus TaxID=8036 RepID=UPI0039FDABDB